MIEQEKQPLEPNTNATNSQTNSQGTQMENDPCPRVVGAQKCFEFSQDNGECGLDENASPTSGNFLDTRSPIKPTDELKNLKAELEVTRRRLAELEGRTGANVPDPVRFRYRSASRNVFSQADPRLPSTRDDFTLSSDTQSFQSEIPSTDAESSNAAPFEHESSNAPFSFTPPELGTAIRAGISTQNIRDIDPPRLEHRSFTHPFQGPIGEPRRHPMYQRSVSHGYRASQDREPLKSEYEWSHAWSGESPASSSGQLTGAASLGVVFNEPLWSNVCLIQHELMPSLETHCRTFLHFQRQIRWTGVVYMTAPQLAVGMYLASHDAADT